MPDASAPEADLPDIHDAPLLLPLLRAPPTALNALSPPLHLLPGGTVSPSRIVFEQQQQPRPGSNKAHVTTWTSTTHLYPSAYPRSHPCATTPPCHPSGTTVEPLPLPTGDAEADKAEEKRRRQLDIKEWARRTEAQVLSSFWPPKSVDEAEERAKELAAKAFPQLWSVVERIVPVTAGAPPTTDADADADEQGYTLLLAHANGFHKETWEPLLPSLLQTLSRSQDSNSKRIKIDEIWSFDTFGSGESGTLNRETMGEVASWFDGVRDILQFIHHYIPAAASQSGDSGARASRHPKHFGPGWPPSILRESTGGASGRKFIAVGHSYSGGCLSMLSGIEPDLFEAIILVDPVIIASQTFRQYFQMSVGHPDRPMATGAVVRKDTWPTRAAAQEYFLTRPFFQAWDRRALENFVRFALRPVYAHAHAPAQGPPVAYTLAMPRWMEAAYFASAIMGAFGMAGLKSGKFRGQMRCLLAERDSVITPLEDADLRQCMRLYGGGRIEYVPGGGHLLVQEKPDETGESIGRAIVEMLGTTAAQVFTPPATRL